MDEEENFSRRDQKWSYLMKKTAWYQEYEERLLGMNEAECVYRVIEDVCDQLGSLMASLDWVPSTEAEIEDYWDMLARFKAQMNGLRGVLSVKRTLERMNREQGNQVRRPVHADD